MSISIPFPISVTLLDLTPSPVVFHSSPVLNFGSGSAYDSNPDLIFDSTLRPAFDTDSATSHRSDLNEDKGPFLDFDSANSPSFDLDEAGDEC
ncbi:hypothetical protein EVAR_59371_1 [Eumeta japonica]|uniref:Uncharacterized protein n=1 Tax=Eumeta variegata TaxID=151549 RepID=A0A4C1ZZC8_EUMVA|nr:hypothetical protein EVAR_59371_1 [Eumeta japonica]